MSTKNDTKDISFNHRVAVVLKRSLQHHPSLLRALDPGMIPGTKKAQPRLDFFFFSSKDKIDEWQAENTHSTFPTMPVKMNE